MTRQIITDAIWEQLQASMKSKGCLIEMLWRPFYGSSVQKRRGEMCHQNFAHGKPRIIVSIAGPQRTCRAPGRKSLCPIQAFSERWCSWHAQSFRQIEMRICPSKFLRASM